MPVVRCPSCGEEEALRGLDDADAKLVACVTCGHRWRRDLTPRCGLCGSSDLEAIPTATLEEAGRGDQRTPSGIRDVHRCWSCGARDATSSSPEPAGPDWHRGRRTSGVRGRARDGSREEPPVAAAGGPVESAFGTFAVGRVVGGRWRLTSLVRRSSTGTLWHAADATGEREIAFGLLRSRPAEVAGHVRAAEAVRGIDHPHLLRVLDVQQRGNDVLIVAEAVWGTPLDEAGVLDAPHVRAAGAAVAGALAALHDRGIAHLDVRPATILVDVPGRGAMLVDLGGGRAGRLAPVGTDDLGWRAPEEILGRRHGPAADVHRLGLTLWTAAGGDLTMLGATAAAQAQRRLAADLPPLADVVPGVDPELAAAVAAATRRRPEDRPTARELAAALDHGPAGTRAG